MDDICLPVRYEEITEDGVKAHLRYCASSLGPEQRVEFLLCDVGIVISVVRRIYKTKSSRLDVLIRSGSVGRDKLGELRRSLSAEGYDLSVSFTSRKKVLRRVVVSLPIESAFMPVTGLNVIRSVALALNLSWPCRLALGYALGSENQRLPGRLVYGDPYRNRGYQFGLALGKLLRKVLS